MPDVSVRQQGRVSRGDCSEPPSCAVSGGGGEHICFYSKQSGADTAGSSSLLLKAFWGLLRDASDGVIYPLFAEWIGGGLSVMYMDVEFQSVILNRDP